MDNIVELVNEYNFKARNKSSDNLELEAKELKKKVSETNIKKYNDDIAKYELLSFNETIEKYKDNPYINIYELKLYRPTREYRLITSGKKLVSFYDIMRAKINTHSTPEFYNFETFFKLCFYVRRHFDIYGSLPEMPSGKEFFNKYLRNYKGTSIHYPEIGEITIKTLKTISRDYFRYLLPDGHYELPSKIIRIILYGNILCEEKTLDEIIFTAYQYNYIPPIINNLFLNDIQLLGEHKISRHNKWCKYYHKGKCTRAAIECHTSVNCPNYVFFQARNN